jgi:hypothetical protein
MAASAFVQVEQALHTLGRLPTCCELCRVKVVTEADALLDEMLRILRTLEAWDRAS